MREVQIVIRDDFDGSPNAETVKFGWDGIEYEVDLSEVNRKEFAEVIQPYLDVARPADGKKKKTKRDRATPPDSPVRAYQALSPEEIVQRREDVQRVRAWAREHGYNVTGRSRVPNAIHDAYNAAHPHDQVPSSTEFTAMHQGDQ